MSDEIEDKNMFDTVQEEKKEEQPQQEQQVGSVEMFHYLIGAL